MKKIAVITTGGTIGSSTDNGIIRVSERENPAISRALAGQEYEVFSPINILSENARPETWDRIARAVRTLHWEEYSGILITHGTDTLCYTGAAIAYTLSDTPIPIVLVSAAYEPDDPRSNAQINVQGAVDFIRTGGLRGVFAAYANDGDPCRIHLAARLEEITACGACLHSYGGAPLGTISDHRFIPKLTPQNPTAQELNQSRKPAFPTEIAFDRRVALIKTYPGIDYNTFDLTGCAAVLHCLYHSGTGQTEGRGSLTEFIRRCSAQGIPSYFTPAHRGARYSTTQQLIAAGAVPLPGVSAAAAYVKLVYCCNTPNAAADLPLRDICFETIE